MLLRCEFISVAYLTVCYAILYDYYTGEPVTTEQIAYYNEINSLNVCTIDINICNADDRRRIDGSCNNLQQPVKGTFLVPLQRVLPADYYNGSYSRKAVSGEDLPLPRVVRVLLLAEGKTINLKFTQAMPGFTVFMFNDIGSVHDILNFLTGDTDCCAKENRSKYMCTPNIIPEDDPVHRFSGIRCMNLTRPLTHQSFGCTKDPVPSPIEQATGVFDLSMIYNEFNKGSLRSFQGGKLATEMEDGKVWPPNGPGYCPMNQPDETRCFGNYVNLLLPINLFIIWFVRYHNYIATELALVNPCWDDEMLFYTAREINIASAMQMYIHELTVQVIGRENLIKSGVISESPGFRQLYNPDKYPVVTLEYTYMLRWYHTTQDETAKMYQPNGTFIQDYSMTDLTLRPGMLAKNDNIVYLTQGQVRQPCKGIDHFVDPDMAERGLPGGVQLALDVPTSDVHKGRLLGIRPYIDYLSYCFGRNIVDFDDLIEDMSKERIELMKLVYKDVGDIDLMAGMWSEKPIEGGSISRTGACLTIDQLKKSMKSDRYWYEDPNRPHAFTYAQLQEIRKFTLASLLCTVGDGVFEVQRNAFLVISPENPVVNCCEIPKIDLSAWTDYSSDHHCCSKPEN